MINYIPTISFMHGVLCIYSHFNTIAQMTYTKLDVNMHCIFVSIPPCDDFILKINPLVKVGHISDITCICTEQCGFTSICI